MILSLLAAFVCSGWVSEFRELPPDQAVERLAGDSSESASFLRAEALRIGMLGSGSSMRPV